MAERHHGHREQQQGHGKASQTRQENQTGTARNRRGISKDADGGRQQVGIGEDSGEDKKWSEGANQCTPATYTIK